MSEASHITLSNVHKSYRVGANTIRALDDLSLSIEAGQFAVVLGPSGSGKTTLLNILGGLEQAGSGTVQVGGQQVSGMDDAALTAYRRRQVGFVFQFFNLLPTLTALENVTLTAEMAGAGAHDPADLLRRVGLGERMEHFPGQLSGGQQQRVAIARSLAKRPALVLADEPTGSLDQATGVEVLALMRQLNRETGQTFVIVTHNAAIARMADCTFHLKDGRVHRAEQNPTPLDPGALTW